MESKIPEQVYKNYLESLLKGDRATCHRIVQKLIDDHLEVQDIYLNLFQRSMYQVGYLWEFNRISVSVEHLATSITFNLLNLLYPMIFSEKKLNKSAVITCIPNEHHQLGAQMVSDIFEMHGWNGYFLGSNTPEDDLLKFIYNKKPDVIALSIAIYFNMQNLWKTVNKLRREFPEIPILVGGQAFRWGGSEIATEVPKVTYAQTLLELENVIEECC